MDAEHQMAANAGSYVSAVNLTGFCSQDRDIGIQDSHWAACLLFKSQEVGGLQMDPL